jgi:hypothetical protein
VFAMREGAAPRADRESHGSMDCRSCPRCR